MRAVNFKRWLSKARKRHGDLSLVTVTVPENDAADLSQFSKQLYEVHNRIFAGLDEAAFVRYVFRPGADATGVRAYLAPDGQIVGYAAVHRYSKYISNRRVIVFRAEAGLLPRYRAHGRTFWFFAIELLRYRLLHPTERIFYLGMLVHPSSYLVFARYFRDVCPRRGHAIPARTQQLMWDLADSFGVPPVDSSDPMLRLVGWRTRYSKPYWQQTEDLDVAYFRERNPGYRGGHGLVVLVPMTLANLVRAMLLYAFTQLRRRFLPRS